MGHIQPSSEAFCLLLVQMWPITLTVLNLPRKMRYSFSNIWLVGTIPGNGTKEPQSLDPYLSVLVDELLSITNK